MLISGLENTASLPQIRVDATELLGGIVPSIDCELAPSLYAPEPRDDAPPFGRQSTMTAAGKKIPNLSLDSIQYHNEAVGHHPTQSAGVKRVLQGGFAAGPPPHSLHSGRRRASGPPTWLPYAPRR